jgi:peptide/nickel transport system substrate-binding protein
VEWPWQFSTYLFFYNARPGSRFEGDKMKPLRQATNYAIDRQAIAATVGQGIGAPAYFHLGSGHVGYNETLMKYDLNLNKAKELMAQAGLASGVDVVLESQSPPVDVQNAQIYKQMLEQIGIRITINQSERVAWGAKMMAGNFELGAAAVPGRADPDQVLGYRFQTGGSGNYSAWSSPVMDKCLEDGRAEMDPAKRQSIYERCQNIAAEEAYYGYSWKRVTNNAFTKKLQGFPDRWTGWYLTKAWLDQ